MIKCHSMDSSRGDLYAERSRTFADDLSSLLVFEKFRGPQSTEQ